MTDLEKEIWGTIIMYFIMFIPFWGSSWAVYVVLLLSKVKRGKALFISTLIGAVTVAVLLMASPLHPNTAHYIIVHHLSFLAMLGALFNYLITGNVPKIDKKGE